MKKRIAIFLTLVIIFNILLPINTYGVINQKEEITISKADEKVNKVESLTLTTSAATVAVTTSASTEIKCDENVKKFIVKVKDTDSKEYNKFLNYMSDNYKLVNFLRNLLTIEICDDENLDEVVMSIRDNKMVDFIQEDQLLSIQSLDPGFPSQWGIKNFGYVMNSKKGLKDADINFDYAWNFSTGKDVVVGVLDTGININHEDLKENIFVNENEIPNNQIDDDHNGYIDDVNGWNFISNKATVYDSDREDWHGTHIAGIISAKKNQVGIIGIAPNTKVLPLKIFSNKVGYTSDAIEAIKYAEEMGVDVLNCSFASEENNKALDIAMRNSGLLFVVAAGNSNKNTHEDCFTLTSLDLNNIIRVGALDNNGKISMFSNTKNVDIYAPGEYILSTTGQNQYSYSDGTSQSAAFVTGTVALLKSVQKKLDSQQIIRKIKERSKQDL